jgi:CHU_C Type IX secretion signal domain
MKKIYTTNPLQITLLCLLFLLQSAGFSRSFSGPDDPTDPDSLLALGPLGHLSCIIIVDTNCATQTLTLEAWIVYSFSGQAVPVTVDWTTGVTAHKIIVPVPGGWGWDTTPFTCEHNHNSNTFETFSGYFPGGIDILGSTAICPFEDLELTVNTQGYNEFSSFQWNPDNSDLTPITVNQPGVYSLTVTDAYGCTHTDQVTVTQVQPFVPQITGQNQICPTGDTTVLTVQGPYFNYEWSSGDTGSPIIVTEPGNYEVTATDVNGCTGVGFFGVLSNGVGAFPVSMTSATLCPGQLDTLSVVGGFSQYHWSNGASGINNIVNQAGAYTVTVTNFSGCTGTGTASVTGIVPPNIQISNTPLCPGGSAMLTALVDTLPHYHWSTNQDTSAITIFSPGTYSVTVSGSGICATSTNIVVDLAAVPTTIIAPPELLTCSATQFPLDGSASSSGSGFPFTWSTQGGNFVSGDTTLTPIINQPGTYILSIVNDTTGCITQDTVLVSQNIIPPGADPGPPATLTCANQSFIIGPIPPPSDTLLLPVWTTINGNILSGDSTWSPGIGQPGAYTLTVTNAANGCTSAASVTIGQDITLPAAQIAPPNLITCTQSSVALDGSGSSSGPNFIYQWSTTNGTISGSSTGISAIAASMGNYTLLVTNTANGCTASTAVSVAADVNIPVVSALPPNTLTCSVQSVTIDASASSNGPGYQYTWTTSNGTIVNGENTLTPVVSGPGTYTLSLLNTANACSATLGVQVMQDIQPPVAIAGPTTTLSCSVSSLQLDGTGSSSGSNFTYLWSTGNGNIVNGNTTLMPTVSLAGNYVLQVTNTTNGCTATNTALVQNDVNAPQALIAPPATLTCTATQINIDAAASTQTGNVTYVWTGPGIVSGQGTLQLGANMPGMYTLQITNNVNGCTDDASIIVNQDIAAPTVMAGADLLINCSSPTGTLGSAANPSGAGYTLVWTTVGGSFSSPIDAPTVDINQAGAYQLQITNNQNGCSATDNVVVQADFTPPTVDAGPTAELTCVLTSTALQGSGSMGPIFNYLWTTGNGNIFSGANSLNPVVNAAGDYNLLITNTQNGCTANDLVSITESADLPTAIAGQPQTLTCTFTSTTLNGAGSSAGPEFAYAWSTTTGNISSGANTLMPVINAPGIYSVTVTNTNNNCTKTASVTISQNIQNPVVDAGLDNTLTCAITSLSLAAQILSSSSAGISYAWSTSGGQITGGGTTASPTIGAAGTYTVVVTDAINGCTGSDQLIIGSNLVPPIALIGNPQTLTCTTTQIPLNTTGSSTGPNFTYNWTTQGGNIFSIQNPHQPIVDAPGTYNVLITNTSNGCTQTASAVVPEDVQLPTAEAGQTVGLDCDTQTNILNGNGSSVGAAFTYLWSTTNGQIISGNSTLMPGVGDPGAYTLLVTNTVNGCTQTDIVLVTEDVTPPTFSIASPAVLTCAVLAVPLSATGTNFGTAPNFSWSTANGNIVNGGNTLNATVNQPGNYTLQVQNTVNGCSSSVPVLVTQNIAPPSIQVQPPPLLTCSVLQFPLQSNASAQTTIGWSTSNGNILSGGSSLNPVVNQPGLYQVLVTSAVNGCSSSAQVTVLRETNVPTGVQFDLTQPLCNGTPGLLNISQVNGGIGPYGYSIDGGQQFFTFQEFDDLAPGSYSLVVQDINGCEITQPITVIPPLQPMVTLPPAFSLHLGANQQLKALIPPPFPVGLIQQVIWEPMDGLTFAGSSILDLLHPVAAPLSTTEYTVTIVTAEGCSATARSLIKVDRIVDIYAPNIIRPEDSDGDNGTFQLFARDESVATIHKLQIFDRWGTLVFENKEFSPNDLSNGWDGMYRGQIVEPAVFVWWAEVELVDGRQLLMKGDVTVVR